MTKRRSKQATEAKQKLAAKRQRPAEAVMDILVYLSQEHALQSVELGRHLLGEVL